MTGNYRTARLALEDGTVLQGKAFGAQGTTPGEVIFNTGMSGYQEILTDPSYTGQIITMTAPHIGNTGINFEDDESRRAFLSGFVIRELSPVVSNWRAEISLDEYLREQGIVGISDVDTRALTRKIRDHGSLKGVISTDDSLSDADLIERASLWLGLDNVDLVKDVTCDEPYNWADPTDDEWEFLQWRVGGIPKPPRPLHIVAYDFGIKRNILRRFATHGCKVTVVPANTQAEVVLALNPDGVFLSNGPGDPAALPYTVEATREVLDADVPVFGICLGHQILGQAFGGKTYRLKFGHHGINQPVKHGPSGRVEISSHNHNFAVDPTTLPADVEVTHVNLNDGCCEGMRHKTKPAISIQYHPESAPGPHDADPLFAEFVQMMLDHMAEGVRSTD